MKKFFRIDANIVWLTSIFGILVFFSVTLWLVWVSPVKQIESLPASSSGPNLNVQGSFQKSNQVKNTLTINGHQFIIELATDRYRYRPGDKLELNVTVFSSSDAISQINHLQLGIYDSRGIIQHLLLPEWTRSKDFLEGTAIVEINKNWSKDSKFIMTLGRKQSKVHQETLAIEISDTAATVITMLDASLENGLWTIPVVMDIYKEGLFTLSAQVSTSDNKRITYIHSREVMNESGHMYLTLNDKVLPENRPDAIKLSDIQIRYFPEFKASDLGWGDSTRKDYQVSLLTPQP